MQEINFFSPSAVRALLASAALFTGMSVSEIRAKTPEQQDQYEETTIASSQHTNGNHEGNIAFPRPLHTDDARRIRRIFDLQRKGEFTTAQSETIQISDNLLLGDILAERYLNPQFMPNSGQLKLWLKNFSSYTDTSAIHKRLDHITVTNVSIILPSTFSKKNPSSLSVSNPSNTMPALDPTVLEVKAFTRNPALDRTVHERTAQGIKGARNALRLIHGTTGINDLYAAQLKAEIAQQLFTMHDCNEALELARQAFDQSRERIGLAGYVAGLISWKNGQYEEAYHFFNKASQADIITNDIHAGTFFWAARTRLKANNETEAQEWLRKATNFSHTFYGILAQHTLKTLKQNNGLNNKETLSAIDLNAIEATDMGKRFFALIQVGEKDRARIVLQQIWMDHKNNPALSHSIQLIAQEAGFRELSQQLAAINNRNEQFIHSHNSLPTPNLYPRHGYKINPALLYALIRLESNFKKKAVSNHGARGLMQIMPVTAKYVAKQRNNTLTVRNASELQNDAVNLEIGQLYLIHLSELYGRKSFNDLPDGGSLIHMLVGYNAGPGIASKWLNMPENIKDPLLFMEAIPIKETKNYLRKALTYLWTYSNQLDLPSPSLDALAHDQWPTFSSETRLAQSVVFH